MSSGVFDDLWEIIKAVIPGLMDAAEKALHKLPKDKQEEAKQISTIVEIVKQGYQQHLDVQVTIAAIVSQTRLTEDYIEKVLSDYLMQKGFSATTLESAIAYIWDDAAERTETGLKALWSEISNVAMAVVANIDWKAVLLGVGEVVYRKYVKDKVQL